jgi:hypothetical protein
MIKKASGIVIILIVTLMVFSYISGVPGKASEEEEMSKLIETASTPEDHMKIAGFYEKEAAKLEEKANSHAAMAEAYRRRTKPIPGMVQHCSNLSKKYKDAAAEYRAMASEHMKMAPEMQ